jgi:hypothetical protein
LAVASDGGPRTEAPRRPAPRPLAAIRTALLTILPPIALAGFVVALFIGELSGGPIAYGRDTTSFYYPLTTWAAGELRAGRLPLWTPLIFGGYPVVADGELGLLSPVQVPLLLSLDTPTAYVWMRVVHYLIAALGLYFYARLLGSNGIGAAIGGLAFAFSSFMVGHLQHDNILRSAVWLPWLLLTAEQALRTSGRARPAWMAAGALVLAFQGLGVHVQPLLMSLLTFGFAVLFGPFGRSAGPGAFGPPMSRAAALGRLVYKVRGVLTVQTIVGLTGYWLTSRVRLGLTVVGVGLGLAAVQLVPLYQLGLRSLRPSLATYSYATSFAVSPPQLLTLFFPSMFNFDTERYWAFWAPHETTLYVGIAPLLLAIVALACIRGRAVTFFGILALVSLVLTLGDYLPIKPYAVVWSLPGFGYLRAPARFSLLFSLAVAVLAALGTTWLTIRARHPSRAWILSGTLTALFFIPLILALAIEGVRWWLRFDPVRATELLRLAIQASHENPALGPWHIYYGLQEFTRPDNPRTAIGLALLVAVPLLLRFWVARPRFEALWGCLLLALTAADLWIFVQGFYPVARLADLAPRGQAISYLTDQATQAGPTDPFRIFVEPALNPRFGANQLVTPGIETINGYSSLEPPRFADYWWSVVNQDNFLLDLFNVRYVLAATQAPGARTFDGTSYYPSDRLLSGTAANPSGRETFRVRQTQASAVVLIGAVEGLGEVPTGTAIGDLTLVGSDGSRQTVPIRGGIDVAEYLAPDPGYPMADYVGPRVIWAGPEFLPDSSGPEQPVRLYGSTIALPQPFDTVSVEVRMLAPSGRLHINGIGLKATDGSVLSVRAIDKAKYRLISQDQTSMLLEDTEARPRVSVVGDAIASVGATTAARLLDQPWNPSRQVMVEGMPASDIHASGADTPAGEAHLLEDQPTHVVVQAEMTAPGYLVVAERYDEGWHAYVDGAETTVARANGLAQAVAVPQGSHTVTFEYRPFPLMLGLGLTVVAALVWLGLLASSLYRAVIRRGR